MLKRVTAVCMDAMPASATRSSHVPGSSARAWVGKVRTGRRNHIRKERTLSIEGRKREGVSGMEVISDVSL